MSRCTYNCSPADSEFVSLALGEVVQEEPARVAMDGLFCVWEYAAQVGAHHRGIGSEGVQVESRKRGILLGNVDRLGAGEYDLLDVGDDRAGYKRESREGIAREPHDGEYEVGSSDVFRV